MIQQAVVHCYMGKSVDWKKPIFGLSKEQQEMLDEVGFKGTDTGFSSFQQYLNSLGNGKQYSVTRISTDGQLYTDDYVVAVSDIVDVEPIKEVFMEVLNKYEKAAVQLNNTLHDPDTADDLNLTCVLVDVGEYMKKFEDLTKKI